MAKVVVGDFVSGLGLDEYKIAPHSPIREYAAVMIILLKERKEGRGGLSNRTIGRELKNNFPDLKIRPLKYVLAALQDARQISKDGGKYGLTGPGFTNADCIAINSIVVLDAETKLDLTSHRFWEYVREYVKGLYHYKLS